MEKILLLFKNKRMLFYPRKFDMGTMGGIGTRGLEAPVYFLTLSLVYVSNGAPLTNCHCSLTVLPTLNIFVPFKYEDSISFVLAVQIASSA